MKKIYGLVMVFSAVLLFSCVSFGSQTPDLHKAIDENNLSQVQTLVENGANLDEQYYGKSALVYAAIHGKNDILAYLITQDKNTENVKKAIREALGNKNYAGAKILVDANIIHINENINLLSWVFSDKELSFEQKLAKVKEIAGENVSSPYFLVYSEPEHYDEVIRYFNINIEDPVDEQGRTLLHVAADLNKNDLLLYLLNNDFDVNSLDNNNHTALFYAITVFGPEINWEKSVIEDTQTAKINFISDMPYYSDPRAVQQRQVQNVLALLDAGININQQNSAGWTVLHFASAAYPEGLSELLIKRGADKNIKTNFNRTADDIKALR